VAFQHGMQRNGHWALVNLGLGTYQLWSSSLAPGLLSTRPARTGHHARGSA